MTLGNLMLFQQSHCNGEPSGSWVLLAWHWKNSITWRWVLSWTHWSKSCLLGINTMRIHKGQGFNFVVNINFPVIGQWSFTTQPNMWRKGETR